MLRDAKLRFARLSPAVRGRAVAVGLLWGLAVVGLPGPTGQLLAQTPAPPSRSAPPEAGETIDLGYLPEDAQAFWALRPASIQRNPQATSLFDLMFPGALPGSIGNEMEQGTLAILSGTDAKATSPRGPEVGLTVIRSTKSQQTHQDAMRHPVNGVKVSTQSLQGKDYYLWESDQATPIASLPKRAFYFPDAYTAVQGSEAAVRQAIVAGSASIPKLVRQSAHWKDFQNDVMVLAADSAGLARILELLTSKGRGTPESDSSLLTPIAPFSKSSQLVLFGLHVDATSYVFHGRAIAKDEADAQQLEAAAHHVRATMLKLFQAARSRGGQPSEMSADIPQRLAQLDRALQKEVVQRNGTVVDLTLAVDLAVLKEGPLSPVAATQAVQMQQTTNKLRQIAIAMHIYHDANRCFPPAVLYGPDGKTPYSWRVALLPYLEQMDLYKQYRQDEPWNSPNNLKVLQKMPDVYRMPSEPADSTRSCFFVLTGPETIFSDKKGTGISQLTDGTSNTLLVVEAQRQIPWTKPEDIPYDATQPLPQLGGYSEGGFWVALADGSVHRFGKNISEKVLRALMTKAGGEIVEVPN